MVKYLKNSSFFDKLNTMSFYSPNPPMKYCGKRENKSDSFGSFTVRKYGI